MQVNLCDNKTNFNGIKLQTIQTPLKKIDIYSLDSRDKNFLKRISDLLQNTTLPADTVKIGNKTPKQITLNALHKASVTTKGDYTSKVLISVENDKNITGILNTEFEGDMTIKGMAAWGDKDAKQGLLSSILKETQKFQDTSLIIPIENVTGKMEALCKRFGFKKPKDDPSIYTIDPIDMKRVFRQLKTSSKNEVKEYKNKPFVDLEKKLLDTNA